MRGGGSSKVRGQGFTLVEVMIAIALMAVVSVMAWRGLESVTRTDSQLERRSDDAARLLRALGQLETDLALRATTELPLPAQEAAGSSATGGSASAAATAVRASAQLLPTALQVRSQAALPLLIEIVRAAPAAPGQWQRVQWWQRGSSLYRAAGEARPEFPLPAPDAADRVEVLGGVASFRLRAWEPGQGWRELPAVAPARTPASGLEAELAVLPAGDGPAKRFRRVFVLEGNSPG